MDLHIKDRLLIPSIFPERGNFMDFNLKKSIARKIAISEQDRKDYEIVEKLSLIHISEPTRPY